jgi:hypothetical protein
LRRDVGRDGRHCRQRDSAGEQQAAQRTMMKRMHVILPLLSFQ